MRDADEKNEAIAECLGWGTHHIKTTDVLLYILQDVGIEYKMRLHNSEHEARIFYEDAQGRRASTVPVQDRDAFTALRDALYQWVKATEDDG